MESLLYPDAPTADADTIQSCRRQRSLVWASPKFPQADWVDAFDQVVEPLITEIACLRSHELRLFHLVSAYIGSPSGGTTG